MYFTRGYPRFRRAKFAGLDILVARPLLHEDQETPTNWAANSSARLHAEEDVSRRGRARLAAEQQ